MKTADVVMMAFTNAMLIRMARSRHRMTDVWLASWDSSRRRSRT